MGQYIMIAFIILLVITLIIILQKTINIDDIKSLSKVSANYKDPVALRLAARLNPKDLQPVDRLRLGGVYINNLGDIDRGQEINDEAARIIFDNYQTFNIMDILTMQDLLNDNLARGFIDAELAMLANAKLHKDTKENINDIVTSAHSRLEEDPEAIQKTLLENIKWQSDAQNVHDEIITKQLREQFKMVVNENMTNCPSNYLAVKEEMLHLCERNHKDILNIFFTQLDKNYPTSFIADGIAEQDVLLAVWNRSNDPRNKHNSSAIKKEIITAAIDSVEKNVSVCITGRVEHIWSSLALLDVNPTVGILKSKQMIRNEILEKSAKIVSDAEEKLDKETLNDYISGDKNPRVATYVEGVRRDIAQMADQYGDAKNSESVNSAIELAISLV